MVDIYVSTTADETAGTTDIIIETNDGFGLSLREAVAIANSTPGEDDILFDPALLNGIITLTQGQIDITDDVRIDGDFSLVDDRRADIAISADGASRLFYVGGGPVEAPTQVVFYSLAMLNGTAPGNYGRGGGILAAENTTVALENTLLVNNYAAYGGGIYTHGDLFVVNSTISGNVADSTNALQPSGGGVYSRDSNNLVLVNSTISGNDAKSFGGGIFGFNEANVFLYSSTITDNYAGNGGGIHNSADTFVVNSVVSGNLATVRNPDFSAANNGGNPVPGSMLGSRHAFFGTDVTGTAETLDIYASTNAGGNAGLIGLADNGGPAPTHGLFFDSPLIDAGDPINLPIDFFDLDDDGDTAELLPFDADSNPRFVGTIDIGAVEFGGTGNGPPLVMDIFTTTDQFVPIINFDLLEGVTDPELDPFFLSNLTLPAGGRTFDNGDGTISYAPFPDTTGIDRFDFTVTDDQGASTQASVEVDVVPLDERIVCARIIAYLYEASLDRFPDLPGLNFWIDAVLGELPEQAIPFTKLEIAEFFLESPEFALLLGGDPETFTDREIVELFFDNTLDRPGETAGVDFWEDVLADPFFTRADLLLAFAQSPENQLGSPTISTLEEVSFSNWDFV